jgi:hemolysin activation/secretion protein
LNAQLSAKSLLGLGEQIYAYLSGNPDLSRAFHSDARRRVAGAGITMPIGDDGLAATVEATIADTKPFVPGAFFQSDGLFKRLDGRVSYPILKSRAESLTVGSAFEYSVQTEVADGFGIVVDEDRLNVLRLSLDWNKSFDWGASLEAFGQLSKGVTWLNGRTIGDAIATNVGFSRAGATPNFSKAEAHLSYTQGGLPYGFAAAIDVRGQLRIADAMPSSELFSLDGEDAISTLTSGSVSGDSGIVGRLEVQRPIVRDNLVFVPYLYGSAGQIFNKYEAANDILKADGYGAGLRINRTPIEGLSPTLSVEAGHDNAGLASANRVMIDLGVSF